MKTLLHAATVLSLVLASVPALAEMYKYVDSQGRVHFTQDIHQVPPEYRHQVEKKVLNRQISITGDGKKGNQNRLRVLKERSDRLQRIAPPTPAKRTAPVVPENPLKGAPEPRKYYRDCWWDGTRQRCKKYLTGEWQRWDAANGGNNGKPTIRRKIGDK